MAANAHSLEAQVESLAHVFDDDDCLARDAFSGMDYSYEDTCYDSEIPEIPEALNVCSSAPISTEAVDSLISNAALIEASPSSGESTTSKAKEETAAPSDSQGLLVAPTNVSDHGFVNVYFVIDPKSNTYLIPKQIISYKGPNDSTVSRAVFGPKFLKTPPAGLTPPDLKATTGGKDESFSQEQDEKMHENKITSTVDLKPSTRLITPLPAIPLPAIHLSYVPGISKLCSKDTMPLLSLAMSHNKKTSQPQSTQDPGPQCPSAPSLLPTPSSATDEVIKPPPKGHSPLPPLRALSAYNFFFRDERERILSGVEADWSESKKLKLLEEHWHQDRNKKRRHRKTHGKIDFTTLSKLISTRWKELPESRKDFYRQVAARDFSRFKEESKLLSSKTQVESPDMPSSSTQEDCGDGGGTFEMQMRRPDETKKNETNAETNWPASSIAQTDTAQSNIAVDVKSSSAALSPDSPGLVVG
ncbi:hypothetical protein ACA910_003233 [Epithemia clementina (nom. ined.)]